MPATWTHPHRPFLPRLLEADSKSMRSMNGSRRNSGSSLVSSSSASSNLSHLEEDTWILWGRIANEWEEWRRRKEKLLKVAGWWGWAGGQGLTGADSGQWAWSLGHWTAAWGSAKGPSTGKEAEVEMCRHFQGALPGQGEGGECGWDWLGNWLLHRRLRDTFVSCPAVFCDRLGAVHLAV